MLKSLGSQQFFSLLMKRMIVGTLLPAFLLCCCFKAFATGNQNWTMEREELLHRQDELKKEEERLLAEMWELQLRAEALKIQLEQLGEEIAKHTQRMEELDKELAVLQGNLQIARQDLARVLKNYYYTGSNAYLEVILTSQSWGDLLIRLELVSRLVAYNQKHIRTVTELEKQLVSKQTELAEIKAATEKTYQEQKERSELLAQAQREKQQALNYAQGVSLELYQKLVQIEQNWNAVFPAIDTLLSSLSQLPWFSVKPDKMSLDIFTGQTVIEVSENNLNKHFSKLNLGPASVNVTIGKDQLTLTCEEEARIELTGRLVMENKAVRFAPDLLLIEGLPVQQATLELLSQEYDLYLDLSKLPAGYKLTKIELLPGLVRFKVRIGNSN